MEPRTTHPASQEDEEASDVIHAPHHRRRMVLDSLDEEEEARHPITIDLTNLLPGQASASIVMTGQLEPRVDHQRRRVIVPPEYDEDTESDNDSDTVVIEESDTDDEPMEVHAVDGVSAIFAPEASQPTPALAAAQIQATHIIEPVNAVPDLVTSESAPTQTLERSAPVPHTEHTSVSASGSAPTVGPVQMAPAAGTAHVATVAGSAPMAHTAGSVQMTPAAGSAQVVPAASSAHVESAHVAPAAGPTQVANESRASLSSAAPTHDCAIDFKSPKKTTPASKSAAAVESDEDSQSCIICYEPWTNYGEHRLASLKCGHLFGHCCILKWLKGLSNQKCPQCNAKAKKTDIRIIYAKALRTLDTSERDRALDQLKKEKEVRRKVEIDMAQANLQLRMAMQEMNRLKAQINAQQDQLRNASSQQSSSSSGQSVTSLNKATEIASGPHGQYILDKTIQISQTGSCRVIGFDQFHSALVVSMPSPNQLFPGFGVKKVSAVDMRCTQYVPVHSAMIRALTFNGRNDGLMLTASTDKTIKMTSLVSNAVVQTYKTDAPVWSCAWNSTDVNYVYAGLQNGAILVYDTRQVNSEVHRLALDNSRCPIVSLNYVPRAADQSLGCGGLLMASLGGMSFWEQTSDTEFKPHLLQLDGKCTSLSFHNKSRHCLASFRPNQNHNSTRHVMCELKNEKNAATMTNEVVCYPLQTFYGGPTMKVLTRSTLYQSPERPDQLYACSGDEATSSALIWDTTNGNQIQKLTVNATILDVCPFQFNRQSFLAALTEKQVKLYTWQPNK
ncbi:E3 ubiquitin-protein ligase RFWD3-like isoform X2 [Patiria miniata]|uniref:RING-type E3 ubiquitin transferase n=1 Tax=Patiria miniata TaxID=46514 RepID=A0A913ZQ09_PATMI|nr:E3 ubiquitin-protein ligase RFWD3-like isoform X2 [Patiria miniata]